MSRTGVVTVAYGSPALLDAHLATTAFGPDTVVVVADNSTDPADRAEVSARCEAHGWHYHPMEGNEGFAAGCNRGAAVAFDLGCDVVVLVNPDASCPAGVLDELVAECRRAPLSMAAPALRRADGRPGTSWHSLDLRTGRNVKRRGFDAHAPGDWLGAACLAVGRDLWEAVGGFDEGYFLYWEDVDFSRRAHAVGARLVLREDLVALHDGGATQGGGQTKSALYVAMNCRNRLRYASVHEPRGGQLRWLLHTPRESLRVAERAGRRTLLRSPALQWAMVRGTLAGVLVLLRGRP